MAAPMPGGVSGLHEITPEVAQLAHHHKADAEKKIGHSFAHFNPVAYAQQVVAGMNYIVKCDVGDGKFVHVKIYRNLKKETSFTDAWFDGQQ